MTTKKNFEIGQQWKCRDGSRAVILRLDTKSELYRWYVWFEGLNTLTWVDDAGGYPNHAKGYLDLIEPWREPRTGELWVNVYPGKDARQFGYNTRERADKEATEDRIACVHVQWTEGEGLGDE